MEGFGVYHLGLRGRSGALSWRMHDSRLGAQMPKEVSGLGSLNPSPRPKRKTPKPKP